MEGERVLRSRRRAGAAGLVVALALASLPLSAAAATRAKPVAHRLLPRAPAAAPASATIAVDHPPVDGFQSFDYGSRSGRLVALTFDADLTPAMLRQLRAGQVRSWYNEDVRDILDAEQVPATIFMTGLWAETYPEVARSLAADPLFELGSHTYDHAAFRTPCYGLVAAADRSAEIVSAQRSIELASGVRPSLLRFPGDCYDRSDVALAASLGLSVISGDVRGGDAFNPNPATIASTVLSAVQPGSIVLLHIHGGPNAPATAPALRTIVAGLRQRGFGFGTVSEVLGRTPARRVTIASVRSLALVAPPSLAGEPALRAMRARALRPPRHPRNPPGHLIP